MEDAGFPRVEASANAVNRVGRTSFSVAFPFHAGIRTELERAPGTRGAWWRARVRGGLDWRVPQEFPWTYGITETGAVEAAVSLWALAGRPGVRKPRAEQREDRSDGADRSAEGAKAAPGAATDDEPKARLVVAHPRHEDLLEYRLVEPVCAVVRAITRAVGENARTITLTRSTGRVVAVKVASIVALYDDDASSPPSEDDADMSDESEDPPARAGRIS